MTIFTVADERPPWWTQFVQLSVELGIGATTDTGTVGRWDTAHWDDVDSGAWSGLEPVWVPLDQCDLLDVSIDRGRDRWLDRFGASSAGFTAEDRAGLLSWDAGADPATMPVRPGIGVRIRALSLHSGIDFPLWRGFLESVSDTFSPNAIPAAKLTCQDAIAQLSHISPPEVTPVGGGESSDERITRLLDAAGWPLDWRDLQGGTITVVETNLSGNVADSMGLTADSEGGAVFADRDGKVAFRNRDWLRVADYATTIQASIGGEARDVCGAQYELTRTGGDVVNDIQLTRVGGTMQRYTDPTSIGLYRQRTFSRNDYICEDDDQIDVLGNRMLAARATGQARIPKLTIQATDDLPTWEFILGVDYGWRIAVHYDPITDPIMGGTTGWTREMYVQGVSHRISPAGWTCELKVDDAEFRDADTWDGEHGWDVARWTEVA